MALLRQAIDKADALGADTNLIETSKCLLARLTSELELHSSYRSLPNVRLPDPNITPKEAREYWQAEDLGHIEETEEYPLPPRQGDNDNDNEEEAEYIWHESESLALLKVVITRLESSLQHAEQSGADGDLCQLCRGELEVKIKNRTILEAKDVEDKAIAVASAQKEAKKLLKKKKKKKGKTK
eukprot:7372125-Ditylum_brightwellii.AAC.1